MTDTTTHPALATEQVRAWDLRPTDTLVDPDTGKAFPITTVTVDEPGRAGRNAHISALVLGCPHPAAQPVRHHREAGQHSDCH